ncbi:hypothetical protein DEB41_00370 [Vibrio anguillarum]|uniref:Uncharacterized protein n=6 Tax=Vibrio anguillarum TaxID=55601 RepID=A0AAW4AKQ9_VIBAN|nr:hypothetical protein N175_00425 [Vibrio anguillarum M3]ASF90669.1 hypothetical protein CEA93_00710 [Vibrio anguillarum]ATA50671.1 hypothetical protein CLI14_13590 [Vibrio anguillarum]AVT69255.1 hypothetical protein B5S57_19680 [Vibrio anguillarum]AXN05962.1 hypothetical protein DEA53_00375 [Vibrio anguillarum]
MKSQEFMTKVTKWLNNYYDDLVKDSSFASLVGGNTLQFEPTLDERFDLVCYDDKINMIFDQDKRLKFFIVKYPLDNKLVNILSTEDLSLTSKMDLSSIKSELGEPTKIVGARKLPGLVKNGWIQYDLSEQCKLTFSLSHNHPNQIVDLRFSVSEQD